ncbi:hypothetical protein [Chondromyces apiculatus]|nr:hypothetical protein [Chondromyces apiculatus]
MPPTHPTSTATLRSCIPFLLLLSAACGNVEADAMGAGDFEPADPGAFEVGSGEDDFEPVQPGAPLAIIGGRQGGYHIWISVRCGSCGPEMVLTYGVEDLDTGEALTPQGGIQSFEVLDEVNGWRLAAGLTAFLNTTDAHAHVGHRVRLWATGFMDDGSPLEAEVEAVISGVDYVDP